MLHVKRIITKKQMFYIIGSIGLSYYVMYTIFMHVVPSIIEINIDPQISSILHPFYKSKILEIIQHNISTVGCSTIKKAFPPVDYISIHMIDTGHILIKVRGKIPLIKLNDTQILTEDGSIIPIDHFCKNSFSHTPSFFYAQDHPIQHEDIQLIIHYIKNGSPYMLHNFYIIWDNKTNCFLISKKDTNYILRTTHATSISKKLLSDIEQLYQTQQNLKKPFLFIFDLRFNERIFLKKTEKETA